MNPDRAIADRNDRQQAAERLLQASHLIVDLDGTLIREDEPIDGAADLLARFRDRYVIVSNNSTHTARGVAQRLARLGLKVPRTRIVLAGEQTIAYMQREHPEARIYLSGSAALRRHALASGCELVRSGAEFVVLALDAHFNHRRLGCIVNALRDGARLVVSNVDATHPGPGGRLVPETGALLAAVTVASGVQPWRAIGKPGPLLLQEGLRRLGSRPEHTLVIGDNPDTDGLGAHRMGMPCVLVGHEPGASCLDGLLADARALAVQRQYRFEDSTSKVLRSVLTDLS